MNEPADTDLRGLAQIIADGWRTIAAVVVALVVLMLVLDLFVRTPQYTSSTSILITPGATENLAATLNEDSDRAMRNELEIARSLPVLLVVEAEYGKDPSVSVVVEEGRDVLTMTATDPEPLVAAEMSMLYADTYLEVRESAMIDEFLRTAQAVQTRIDEIDAALAAIGTEDLTSAQVSERDVLVAQRSLLVQRLDDLALNSELARAGTARVLSDASVPDDPSSPSVVRDVLLVAVGGFVLGMGLAYLRHIVRDSDPRRASVDRALGGVPVLGEIPFTKGRAGNLAVAALADPRSPMVESFRTTRTAVEFMAQATGAKVIQFASARPSDGKTTAVANLGVVLAEQGRRTVLIDADLRNPSLSTHFGLAGSGEDLGSFLSGMHRVEEVVRELTDHPELAILPARRISHGGTAELLSSHAFTRLLDELAASYDFILIDTSPLLAVADPLVVAEEADAVILAVGRETDARDVERAVDLLAGIDVSLAGVVHNGVKVNRDAKYGAYYGHHGRRTRSAAIDLSFQSVSLRNAPTASRSVRPRRPLYTNSERAASTSVRAISDRPAEPAVLDQTPAAQAADAASDEPDSLDTSPTDTSATDTSATDTSAKESEDTAPEDASDDDQAADEPVSKSPESAKPAPKSAESEKPASDDAQPSPSRARASKKQSPSKRGGSSAGRSSAQRSSRSRASTSRSSSKPETRETASRATESNEKSTSAGQFDEARPAGGPERSAAKKKSSRAKGSAEAPDVDLTELEPTVSPNGNGTTAPPRKPTRSKARNKPTPRSTP